MGYCPDIRGPVVKLETFDGAKWAHSHFCGTYFTTGGIGEAFSILNHPVYKQFNDSFLTIGSSIFDLEPRKNIGQGLPDTKLDGQLPWEVT